MTAPVVYQLIIKKEILLVQSSDHILYWELWSKTWCMVFRTTL